MKDSGREAKEAAHSAQPNQLASISERKLKANRENARKSTGPKTARGKAFSRRNAVRHGLFVNYVTDFEALDEDPKEYRELLNGLWDQYQPAGRAEEIEVERIALCCWRLKRVWRYENAVNLAARRDFVRAEMHEQLEYCEGLEEQEAVAIAQLETAKKEIADSGAVSQELKQRIFAIMPDLEELWSFFVKRAEERMEQPDVPKAVRTSPKVRTWARDVFATLRTMNTIRSVAQQRSANVRETAVGRHAVPSPEALDRILRYETTIERYLSRGIERLERLQQRRRGEYIPPAVRVHLA